LALFVESDLNELRQVILANRKRQVNEQSKKRYADHYPHPNPLLLCTKALGPNAKHRARNHHDPNDQQANPDLPIEFGSIQGESFEGMSHKGSRAARAAGFAKQLITVFAGVSAKHFCETNSLQVGQIMLCERDRH